MRKGLPVLITAFVLVGIVLSIKKTLPIYSGFLPQILILVAVDVYLWYSVKNKLILLKPALKYPGIGLYWLPLMMIITSIVTGVIIPFMDWNIFFRTYIIGVITIAYASKFIVILFVFISDVLSVLQFIFGIVVRRSGVKFDTIRRSGIFIITGWILGSGVFLLFMCGMIFWNFDFRIKEKTIRLPELPSSFDGIRIIQVSDIHLGSWSFPGKLKDAVEVINSQNPDIVFFTGDMVNFTSYESYKYANILKEIKAPLGIYAIMGNHDYGNYVRWSSNEAKMKNLDYLHEIYKYMGWKLLLNEHVIIHRGGDSIAVAGVENWGGTKRFPRLGNIDKATKGTENMAVQLLLSHDPSHWDKIIKNEFKNIDITFSGHTHGFQFGVECCGIKWSPSQYIYTEWAGLYSEPVAGSHPQYIYVNRGLGSLGYPGRIGILPEITLFVIKKGN